MSTSQDSRSQGALPVAPPHPRRWLTLCVLLLAAAMELLDTTIVNVAIPAIDADLRAGEAAIEWTVAGYTLAFAVLLITGGRLGDAFGRRRTFLVGVAGFTAASLLCGLSQAPEQLVTGRIIQGAFAALMVPQVLAMIRTSFTSAEQPKAYGLYGAFVGLATVSGPVAGGLLVQGDLFGLGWRPIFLVNVPIGLIALVAAAVLMPESASAERQRFDLGGVGLLSSALVLLTYPLVQNAEGDGWSVSEWVMLAASAPLLGAFLAHEHRRARAGGSPLVPLRLFSQRSFTGGVLVSLAFFSGIGGLFIALTITLQQDLGFSPLRTGVALLPWSLGIFVASGVSVQLVGRLGRRLIVAGTLAMAGGMATLLWTVSGAGAVSSVDLVPGLLLAGLGMGMVAPTIIDVILGGVRVPDAGAASGVLNTALQLGAALGVVFLGSFFFAQRGHASSATSAVADLSGLELVLTVLVGLYLLTAMLTLLLLSPGTRPGGTGVEDDAARVADPGADSGHRGDVSAAPLSGLQERH
jgi:EmrB/QacA subfamily drug resistance transporter